MRKTIFISHASPEDNDFTRWLSLQLIGQGYEVWSDVIKLKGGDDWWPIIENEIRNNAIKFLVVLSTCSNQKDGVLKELAVAAKVKKALSDDRFIVPLHIDKGLSYDDINIELNRLNSINFKQSWADGLKSLLELLEEERVEKSIGDFEQVKAIWETVYLQNKEVVAMEEVYTSNWFPVVELPKLLRLHKFKPFLPEKYDLKRLDFPAVAYGQYIVTFGWFDDFLNELPGTLHYNPSESINIPVEAIFSDDKYPNLSLSQNEAKRIIVQLLNRGFTNTMTRKQVRSYDMSNSVSYWVPKGILEKDKYDKVLLLGKQKEKTWHYGISANCKLFPEKCFVVKSHIWFTSDGTNLIESDSVQHSARRKQGKNWWNNDWRNKLLAFMKFLADDGDTLLINLGSQEQAKISCSPMLFQSPVKYNDPNKENLPEDNDVFEEELSEVYEEAN